MEYAKLRERLESGKGLPDYFKNHPVYYAGPAKTPEGYASGSFGPTTAGRMDSFVDQFQSFDAVGHPALVERLQRGDFRQPFGHVAHADALEGELLAARQDGSRDFVRFGGGEDEIRVRRGFFEGF